MEKYINNRTLKLIIEKRGDKVKKVWEIIIGIIIVLGGLIGLFKLWKLPCPWCGERHIPRNIRGGICKKTKKKVYVCPAGRHAYKTKKKADSCPECNFYKQHILPRAKEHAKRRL